MAVLAACGGPIAPIDVASKELPLDILLGKRVRTVAEAPVAPFVIPPAAFEPGGVFAREPTTSGPPPTLPFEEEVLSDCPARDLLKPPRLVARHIIERPPVKAQYLYRTVGELRVGADISYLEPTSTWVVDNIATEDSGWTFDVAVTNRGLTTTTTYRVLTAGVEPPPVNVVGRPQTPTTVPRPATATPGLYLAGTTGFSPPFPGLAVTHFPIEPGVVVDATASDGATTRTQRSVVEKKALFDACGTPIESFVLSVIGRLVSVDAAGAGAQPVDFSEVIWLAPQYGGLFLAHRSDVVGSGAARKVEMKASREPEEPR